MIIQVTNQSLTVDGVIAEGALNFATFELRCDDSWSEFVKTVRFATEEGIYDIPEVEEGRAYYLPHEILREGRVLVGVVGVSGDSRVATTEKASFQVKGAIGSGGTPTATADAYAKFVNEVRAHREVAERAEKNSLDALEKCNGIITQVKALASEAVASLKRTEKLRDEVYGMMNAVGMAYRDVKRSEESITSTDSRYSAEEKKRSIGERARAFSESKRASSEEERRQRELEREASESRRNTAEQVRALSEVQRNECLKELDRRLTELEEKAPLPLTHITFTESGHGRLCTDECTQVKSITLYGNTLLEEGFLKGVGDNGFVSLTADGSEISIPVSHPLYSVGKLADSVTLDADGCVTVCRRTKKITVSGVESFVCDKGDDGSITLVTPLEGECPLYDSCETVSSLPDGCTDVFINGDYLFFCVDGNLYPDIPTFADALKSRPAELIYPILREREETEGSVTLASLPRHVGYSGRIEAECQKDIFRALNWLNERINKSEKEKTENEDT